MKKILSLLFTTLALTGFCKAGQPKDSIDVMIGQMILVGIGNFDKVDYSEPIFSAIKEGKVGGIVLYEKNIRLKKTKPRLASLIEGLQKYAETPLFVSIDEEGGRVSRLKTKYGFPKNVSAQYLGELNNLDSTRYYANQTALMLKNLGINMNYAPVVDVNLNTENPVIGKLERSYSEDYHEVINQAYEVIDQHNRNDVVPVLKHFPGHGSSRNDTHLGLADVTKTWQMEEIYPYAALIDSGVVKAVMTAHIVNRTLDGSKSPATLSKSIITGMLRELLGFNGVIISDDLQMGAIHNEYEFSESIKLSIEAGVDLLMFANNVPNAERISPSTIHAIIKKLLLDGIITRERIHASYKRIMKLKTEIGLFDVN